jgi:hypothetical protein
VHAEAVEQTTPPRLLNTVPDGLGVDWIFQLVPSHASANARLSELPTAVQAVAAVQDTPARLPLGPVDWLQLVPFHVSTRVKLSAVPTAMQAFAAEQEMAFRALLFAAGLGVDWIAQLVPFHTSAKVKVFEPL